MNEFEKLKEILNPYMEMWGLFENTKISNNLSNIHHWLLTSIKYYENTDKLAQVYVEHNISLKLLQSCIKVRKGYEIFISQREINNDQKRLKEEYKLIITRLKRIC